MPPTGMAGWLFQATWVPQHLMAASCVVTAMLLVTRYALRQNLALVVTIALLVVAGFESSAFVGGIAFAVAAVIAAPILLSAVDPQRRLRFVGGLAIAALLVVCLIAPFLRDQLAAVAAVLEADGAQHGLRPGQSLKDRLAQTVQKGRAMIADILPA